MTRYFAACLCFSVLFHISCGKPEYAVPGGGEDALAVSTVSRPEATARAFFEAANAGDKERFETLLTAKAWEGLNSGNGKFDVTGAQYESWVIGSAAIKGDEADVPVEVSRDGEPESMRLEMRRQNGEWRISGIGMEVSDGTWFTVELEKLGGMMEAMAEEMGSALKESMEASMRDFERGGSEEELAVKKAGFDAIKAMAPASVESSWIVGEDFDGQAAWDVLETLADEIGLVLHAPDHEERLQSVNTASVKGLSRLEAIERVAEAHGLYPVYPDLERADMGMAGGLASALAAGMGSLFEGDDAIISVEGDTGTSPDAAPEKPEIAANAIRFETGKRPFPVAFGGPFIFEVLELKENPPHATGSITVGVKSFGLDPGVTALINAQSQPTEIQRIDSPGDPLWNDNTTYYSTGKAIAGAYANSIKVDLKNLLRNVVEIGEIAGVQRLVVPLEVSEVHWDSLTPGAKQVVNGIDLELKRTGQTLQFVARGPAKAIEQLSAQSWILDDEGANLGIFMQDVNSWNPGEAQINVNAHREPASVTTKLILRRQVVEFPFSLSSVPLSRYAEMPERLEALDFSGADSPVTATFIRRVAGQATPSEVVLNLANHSNKDVLTARGTYHYLDENGAELDTFPFLVTGTYTVDGQQPYLEQGAAVEDEVMAPSMPEGTVSVNVVVENVEFVDGTEWDAE